MFLCSQMDRMQSFVESSVEYNFLAAEVNMMLGLE